MNAEDIIRRVIRARGFTPSPVFIYLGRDEMRALEDCQDRGDRFLSVDQKRLCGIPIRFSCEKSR